MMKKILIRLIAGFILQIECLCLVGVIKFTDGYIYVRLVNPTSSVFSPSAGRLEVRLDYGAWGTVCDDGFTDAAARVVCASLGFSRTGGKFIQNAFGPGSGSIWLDDVVCTGSESSINSCGRSSWATHNCQHGEDVSISCGHMPVKLVNPSSSLSNPSAGRLAVWHNGTWGTVCDDRFTDAAARVICASLGFGRTGKFIQNAFGPGPGSIWLDEVLCTGSETSIDSCAHSSLGSHDCQHSEDVSISCAYTPVRLINPSLSLSRLSAGRLEVQWYNGTWGTVCDDAFTDAAARVVCARLGFGRTGWFIRNQYGSATGPIWLDDVICNGSEIDINDCSHRPWGSHNCGHSKDVSISCIDVDECSTGRSQCNVSSTICVNTVGSYRCSCRSGFRTMNATSCTDIDECSTGQSQCDSATTTCINTVGSYRCSCRNGYRAMTSTSCTDIDECSTGQSQCDSATTTCINTVGDYDCSCKSGYRPLNSLFCADVDECERGDLCDTSTTICMNSAGSYHCACRTGYRRENETLCADTDECVSGESKCDMASTDCTNTIGNYTCRCKMGFAYLNETMCLVTESSHERLGVIVGTSAGTFLVFASIAILFLVFYWKRRKEVDQPQQTECSGVNSCRRSDDRNSKIANVYMPLEPTECDMAGKRADHTKNAAYVHIPAPNEKSKMTAESANDEDIYTNVQFVCDEDVECEIYENVRSANDEDVESAIYEELQV